MSPSIPLSLPAPDGNPGKQQSGAVATPLEAASGGQEFVDLLAAMLGGEEGELQPLAGDGQPTVELPPAGEGGKILPPVMPSAPLAPPVHTPELAEAPAVFSRTQPGVTKGVPTTLVIAAPQNITADNPESSLTPLQPVADPVGDPEVVPLQPVPAARELPAPNTPRSVEGIPLPPGSGSITLSMPPGSDSSASAAERPSLPITAQLHSPQWQSALGERMVWMVKRDLQQAELRLNPQHLGPVEVRIEIRNEQASITFSAHHAVTRDALEAAIPRLREMLGENGVNLASVDISRQHTGSGQGRQRDGEGEQRQDGRLSPEEVAQNSSDIPAGGRVLYGGVGLVDLFA